MARDPLNLPNQSARKEAENRVTELPLPPDQSQAYITHHLQARRAHLVEGLPDGSYDEVPGVEAEGADGELVPGPLGLGVDDLGTLYELGFHAGASVRGRGYA